MRLPWLPYPFFVVAQLSRIRRHCYRRFRLKRVHLIRQPQQTSSFSSQVASAGQVAVLLLGKATLARPLLLLLHQEVRTWEFLALVLMP